MNKECIKCKNKKWKKAEKISAGEGKEVQTWRCTKCNYRYGLHDYILKAGIIPPEL